MNLGPNVASIRPFGFRSAPKCEPVSASIRGIAQKDPTALEGSRSVCQTDSLRRSDKLGGFHPEASRGSGDPMKKAPFQEP
jgi:hypothetical protein